nr:amino acid permease [Nocardioides panaciterrulae]
MSVVIQPSTTPSLGRARGVALYLASLLGAGLLVMPALTYRAAGPASLLAWVLLLALSPLVAFTFAELGARRADSGGVATYVGDAFGDRGAATVGFWFVLALPLGAPATAVVGGGYVAEALGLGPGGRYAAAAVLLLAAIGSALAGVRVAGGVQLALVAALALVLVIASVGALPQAHPANLTPFSVHGVGGIAAAVGVLFFSFAGWEAVAPLTQEFGDPRRDVRLVTIATLAIVTVLYLLVAVTSVLVLGPGLAGSTTPVQQLLALRFGAGSSAVTAALAAALTYGAMTSYLTGASRMAAALARDGWLPAGLSRGHERGGTPRRAAAVIGVACVVVLTAVSGLGMPLRELMALPSAMFITVTAAGLWAGARLLTGGGRLLATAAAVVLSLVLLGCGAAALYPLAVAVLPALSRRRVGSRRAVEVAPEPVGCGPAGEATVGV